MFFMVIYPLFSETYQSKTTNADLTLALEKVSGSISWPSIWQSLEQSGGSSDQLSDRLQKSRPICKLMNTFLLKGCSLKRIHYSLVIYLFLFIDSVLQHLYNDFCFIREQAASSEMIIQSGIRGTEKTTEKGGRARERDTEREREGLKYGEKWGVTFRGRDKLGGRHAHSNLHNGDLLTLFPACLVDSIHTVQHPIR